jgi:transmembrane sensor
MDGGPQDRSHEDAARWYARLRADDCTPEDRAAFEAWRARDRRNAVAYATAERLGNALAQLAIVDPRLQALVDQAASAGATLPDDPEEEVRESASDETAAAPAPWRGAARG